MPSVYKNHCKVLDNVAEYFGEKFGFYFAWLIHYTSWLLLPSICGLIMQVYTFTDWRVNRPE